MNIELGLSRITKLLSHLGNPHESLRVLHIAGTNGKGSVCSYISTILQNQNLQVAQNGQNNKVGKFTTPHLIHVTDSITINNNPIPRYKFDAIKKSLNEINSKYSIKCSEFELLTCLAILYFKEAHCNWCVLEVGLGGRLDATNVIPGTNKLACGITKISLDHENFLGDTLTKIAYEKAGIITPGVKFVSVDGTNDINVLNIIKEQCNEVGCDIRITDPSKDNNIIETDSWGVVQVDKLPLNGEYQIFNLKVALSIIDHLQKINEIKLSKEDLLKGLHNTMWPGRLQHVNLSYDKGKSIHVLMDGAHNGSAAIELSKYIKNTYGGKPITYIIAVTEGKNITQLFDPLLSPKDSVYVTRFGNVEGMPWVHATDPGVLRQHIQDTYTPNVISEPDIHSIFIKLASIPEEDRQPIVICGSLYLCGELLRLHNNNNKYTHNNQ